MESLTIYRRVHIDSGTIKLRFGLFIASFVIMFVRHISLVIISTVIIFLRPLSLHITNGIYSVIGHRINVVVVLKGQRFKSNIII